MSNGTQTFDWSSAPVVKGSSPQGFDWSKAPVVREAPAADKGALSRFGAGLEQGAKGVVQTALDILNPTMPVFAGEPVLHVGKGGVSVRKSSAPPEKTIFGKYIEGPSMSEAGKGLSEIRSGHPVKGWMHMAAASVPVVGPGVAGLSEQAASGDVAGAFGQAIPWIVAGKAGEDALGGKTPLGETAKAIRSAASKFSDIRDDFTNRAKSLTRVDNASVGLMQSKLMPAVTKMRQSIADELNKTSESIATANEEPVIDARVGQSAMDKFMEKTGYVPDGQAARLYKMVQQVAITPTTFRVLRQLRSDLGDGASAALRRGDNEAYAFLDSGREAVTDALAKHAESIGMGDAWNHFNRESRSMYDLQKGVLGDLLDSKEGPGLVRRATGDENSVVSNMTKLASKVGDKDGEYSSDLKQMRDAMSRYGLNTKSFDDALAKAKSLAKVRDVLKSNFGQSLYRLAMNPGKFGAAAAGISAYALLHGAGIYGFTPYLIGNAIAAVASRVGPEMEAGRIVRGLEGTLPRQAFQTMEEAEGPRKFTPTIKEPEPPERPYRPATRAEPAVPYSPYVDPQHPEMGLREPDVPMSLEPGPFERPLEDMMVAVLNEIRDNPEMEELANQLQRELEESGSKARAKFRTAEAMLGFKKSRK